MILSIASLEERQWMAERDLIAALRQHGPESKQAKDAAIDFCRLNQVNPFIPRQPVVQTVQLPFHQTAAVPYTPHTFIEPWQRLIAVVVHERGIK